MNIYSRARRHINMERVKELKEEKYIKNLERQQEIVLAEISRLWKEKNKHYDWRTGKDLTETMTTAAIGLVNLPAEGDVDIIDTKTSFDGVYQSQNYSRSGNTVTLAGSENDIVGGSHTAYRVARFSVDGTKSSTLKITISKGGGTTDWLDREGEAFDDHVTLNVGDRDDFFAPLFNTTNLGSGTHLIKLPGNYTRLYVSLEQFAKVPVEGDSRATGSLRVTNVSLQRRTPVSVLVSLDDPDASSFIRDGKVDTLSPSQKKKELEKQLRSSDEYMVKQFGEGMPKTATTISDTEPQQSFVDMASDARNPMGTGDQAAAPAAAALLASPMVQAAAAKGLAALAALVGGVGTAKQIMNAINNSSGSSSAGMGTSGETSQQAQEREAADKKLADAEAQYGADSDEAVEARRERSDTLTRHKRERRSKTGSTTGDARRQREAEQEAAKKRKAERERRNQEARNRENEEKIRRQKERERRQGYNPETGRMETYKPGGKVIKERKRLKSPKGLIEQMTTAAIGLVNLPAEGDVDLANVTKTATPGTDNSGGSGGSYSFGDYDGTGNAGFSFRLDTRKYDTLKFSASGGNATKIELSVGGGGFQTLSSGTNLITISSANRGSSTLFTFNAEKSGGSGSSGASISGTVFQRRTPIPAFIGLDDPEASAFVRDGDFDRLSNAEKKKRLEEQLRSSDEYLNKMFGKGMPKGATTIADTEPQKSFSDIAGLRPDGTQGFNKPGDEVYDPATKKKYKLVPRKGYGYNQWVPIEKAGRGDTMVAGNFPKADPSKAPPPIYNPMNPGMPTAPGGRPFTGSPGAPGGKYPMAKLKNKQKFRTTKKRRIMVAHHEPQGETIMENNKKSFNDLTKKIPGYYDGKPAPLGFPIVEPPKMKNGMHPDLVDGKKTAKRFNRLDPVSARAMPKTGNPHIDKKVRAAAKKPK